MCEVRERGVEPTSSRAPTWLSQGIMHSSCPLWRDPWGRCGAGFRLSPTEPARLPSRGAAAPILSLAPMMTMVLLMVAPFPLARYDLTRALSVLAQASPGHARFSRAARRLLTVRRSEQARDGRPHIALTAPSSPSPDSRGRRCRCPFPQGFDTLRSPSSTPLTCGRVPQLATTARPISLALSPDHHRVLSLGGDTALGMLTPAGFERPISALPARA
jgi:hypothetical protein